MPTKRRTRGASPRHRRPPLARLEPTGGQRTRFDLGRIDAGAFLTWRHPWVEPSIEVRRIEYDEPQLPRNDYDATIVALTFTRRFGVAPP